MDRGTRNPFLIGRNSEVVGSRRQRRFRKTTSTRLERLEPRTLLAADVVTPAILGTVYDDANGDGIADPSEVLEGVSIELWSDTNRDRVFQSGIDQRIASVTTDADGQYCFDELDPDLGYFVARPAQSVDGEALSAVVSPVIFPGRPNTIIDEFLTRQTVSADPVQRQDANVLLFGNESEVIGRERDLSVELLTGVGEVELAVNPFGLEELLAFNNAPGVTGNRTITWDGVDNDPSQLAFGLGGRDLTSDGANTGIVLRGGVDASGIDTQIVLQLFGSSEEVVSQRSFTLPQTGGDASGFIFIPFEEFAGTADISDVSAIRMLIEGGAEGSDGKIALIGALGPKQFDFNDVVETDLTITKTNGVGALVAGEPIVYRIRVENRGPSAVQGARVVETYSSSLVDVTYTSQSSAGASGATAAGVGAINDRVNLAPGATIIYNVSARVAEGTTQTVVNRADVIPPTGVVDTDVTNNSATDRDPIGTEVDLQITKDDAIREVNVGDTIRYRIDARNNGPVVVRGARIVDVFPTTLDNISFVSAASAGASGNTESATNATGIDDLVDIPVRGVISYIVTGTVSSRAVGTLVNKSEIIAPEGLIDVFPENNIETDVDLVRREIADVMITKSGSRQAVVPGQSLVYTIVVSNNGPSNAARLNVVDPIPDGLVDASYTSQQLGGASGATSSGTGDIDDVVDLPNGASIIYTVSATVSNDATGEILNIASVTVPEVDPIPGNNVATLRTPVGQEADLAITKSDAVTSLRPGDSVSYEIVVSNQGPSDVVGARVGDVFPSQLTGTSYTREVNGQSELITADRIDERIDLAAGASMTYTVTGTVSTDAPAGALANTATVTAPDGITDPSTGNNTATDVNTIVRSGVDVAVRKFSDPPTAVPGQSVEYTLIVSNVGETSVSGAQVTENLPASLSNITFTSTVIGGASGNTESGTGAISDSLTLDRGASVIYRVTADVDSAATGVLQNLVTVDLAGQNDLFPANNFDVDVIALTPHANLRITKSDGLSEASVGDTLSYQVVVSNDGPSMARDVQVTDAVPFGLQNVQYSAEFTEGVNGVTVAGQGSLIDQIDLPVGATVTYTVTGVVTDEVGGRIVNRATVQGPITDGFVELDPSDNVAEDIDTIRTVTILGSEPTVIRDDAIVDPGATHRYQITAHQTGKLILNTFFEHQNGDLSLAIFDADGDLIGNADSANNNESLVVPVVGQRTYFVNVSAADEATNRYSLEIENFAAPVPQILRITAATDSGMMSDDSVTNVTQPTVVVQADLADFFAMGIPLLEPAEGETTLPNGMGVSVGVMLTHLETGDTVQGFARSVGTNGHVFEFTPQSQLALANGQYVVSAFVQVADGNIDAQVPTPNIGRSALSDPFSLMIDTVAPQSADRPNLIDSSDSGMSFRDNVTNKMSPAIAGVGEPNTKVRLLANRINGDVDVIGQGVVNSDGTWEITVEPLDDDVYHVRAEFEDLAGNVSEIGEPLVIEVDTIAPNTPFLDLLRSSDNGILDSDNVTNNASPSFSMTTEDPVRDQHEIEFNLKFRLFVRPDAVDGTQGQETLIYDSSVDAELPVENLLDGLTDLEQLIRSVGPLPDGVHNFKLEVEDRAGNISEDFLLDVVIDTVAPTPDIELLPSSDSGMFTDDQVTNKMSPAFDGVSEVGSAVELFANGRLVGRGTVGSDESDGVPGDGMGTWEITSEPLTDGEYAVSARFEDLAGNTSVSDAFTIWVDTLAPNVPFLDLVTDSGFSTTDNVTRDATPTITITAAATTQGGNNPFPNDIKYRVYDRPGDGTGEVLLIDSFGALREMTNLGFFTETLPELADGIHNLKVEIEDRAGNISHAFLDNILIDTQVPAAADFALLTSSDSGMSPDDGVTQINQPTVSGISTVGDTVRLYANDELVGYAIVQSDASDGIPGDGLGQWEITSEPLADGTYPMRVDVEDLAGNLAQSNVQTVVVDTQSPNQPFLDLLDDSGNSNSDNVTQVNTPTVSIVLNDTLDGGANPFPNDIKYRIYDRTAGGNGETLIVDSFAAANDFVDTGQIELTLPELSEGLHNLKLEVEDRAGNVSRAYLLDMIVDTQAPASTQPTLLGSSDSGMFADDAVTSIDRPSFTGLSTPGESVFIFANDQLLGTGVVGVDATDGVLGNGLGVWQVTLDSIADGGYDISVHIEDLAGNATQADGGSLMVDTVKPNIPHLGLIDDSGISDSDAITNQATPNVVLTFNDTPGGGANPFPNDLKIRLYDRTLDGGESLIYDSFAELGDFTELSTLNVTLPELADGVHNLKLEVEDRAGNISDPFLLEVKIDTEAPLVGDATLDLADYADSGMNSADNVTNIRQPAILGTGTVGDSVLILANGEVVGRAVVGSDLSDGVEGNGLGAWEATLEPLDDDVYDITALVEDVAGNATSIGALTIEVDTIAPNTPFLDLFEVDDSGRHDDDNITSAASIRLTATSHDANSALHEQLTPDGQNFKYRIFARPEEGTEVLVYNSVVDASLADLLDGLTALTRVETPAIELPEGLHNLKLEVEDRAGNISEDFLMSLLVDRTAFAGQAMLHPDSDTGVIDDPSTFVDGITSHRTPVFTGAAEANSLVTVTIDGVPAGTAVALPFDGDDATQPPDDPNLQGNWTIESSIVLTDGMHDVVFTFEDPAGNTATVNQQVMVDASGPQITNITTPDLRGLFDPKPSSGPDPLIRNIVIHLSDATGLSADSLRVASAVEEGHYRIVGDANGNIPIRSVDVVNVTGGAQVILNLGIALPDDRFTFTISDQITDLSGNRLDGESGAAAPFEGQPGRVSVPPIFPAGDGLPGGDFVARFTVDSRPEIGTWGAGSVWTDTNGNFDFDPDNVDYVNRDIIYKYGFTSDDVFAGNFALPGKDTDGFDKLGAYGLAEGSYRWIVDTDNDGVPNIDRVEPLAANGIPVAGQLDASVSNGDEVAVYNGRTWFFDTNHDFQTDTRLSSNLVGYPIIGDFDGDGFDDLATWADDMFMIDFANGRLRGWDGFADERINFGFIGVRERPVAADMDQDGVDDLGLWVPDREGVTDRASSEWYFLISNGASLLERISPPDDPFNSFPTIDFTPIPFGPDIYAQFGDDFAAPIVGNFDPPIVLAADRETPEEIWRNPTNHLDVNDDTNVTPTDALLVINELNSSGPRALSGSRGNLKFLDVNGDGMITPLDALLVMNELNRVNYVQSRLEPRTAVPANAIGAALVDAAIRDDAADEEMSELNTQAVPETTQPQAKPLELLEVEESMAETSWPSVIDAVARGRFGESPRDDDERI